MKVGRGGLQPTLLQVMQGPVLFQGLDCIADDVVYLLAEIDRLNRPGSSHGVL
jgi:hypothetical protein